MLTFFNFMCFDEYLRGFYFFNTSKVKIFKYVIICLDLTLKEKGWLKYFKGYSSILEFLSGFRPIVKKIYFKNKKKKNMRQRLTLVVRNLLRSKYIIYFFNIFLFYFYNFSLIAQKIDKKTIQIFRYRYLINNCLLIKNFNCFFLVLWWKKNKITPIKLSNNCLSVFIVNSKFNKYNFLINKTFYKLLYSIKDFWQFKSILLELKKFNEKT